MKIGNIEINNPVIMAPMAGITNLAFRKIVKEFGEPVKAPAFEGNNMVVIIDPKK